MPNNEAAVITVGTDNLSVCGPGVTQSHPGVQSGARRHESANAVPPAPTFALLDDATASADTPTSRLYTEWVETRVCAQPEALDRFWSGIESAMADGQHALLRADYEFGVRLNGVAVSRPGQGALRVMLFRRMQRLCSDEVSAWLCQDGDSDDAVAVAAAGAQLGTAEFFNAIDAIQTAIHAGETYQVNYTYRLDLRLAGPLRALYVRLRQRQPVRYGALIHLPASEGGGAVMSFSPELFLRNVAGVLTARPMKGTAPRECDIASDLLAREQLALPKNRAENLMIVDLLRNDLGRVAQTGSVRVPALFEVEQHPTVWQMTSTVEARLRPDAGFPDVLRALFPCGSITGAPKHRTLQLIDRLEGSARELYCGALGWVDRRADSCPDFCLSVPIRTLLLEAPRDGWRPARLGIGAGIVSDSTALREHDESQLKARFVTGLATEFGLIETMRVEHGRVALLERHLERLAASALALHMRCDPVRVRTQIEEHCARLATTEVWRLRLCMNNDGGCTFNSGRLEPAPDKVVRLGMAERPIDIDAWPLQHKTTVRGIYERSLQAATAAGVFDLLHFNNHGELTEGSRCNVLLRIDARWYTPAVHCGVLPGVMRAALLNDPAWSLHEAVLQREDLARADEVRVCNALRGVVPAKLV